MAHPQSEPNHSINCQLTWTLPGNCLVGRVGSEKIRVPYSCSRTAALFFARIAV